jgi:hypothetical protein
MIYLPNIIPVLYFEVFSFPGLATSELKVPKIFNARDTFDCIVGLKNLDTQDVSGISPHLITSSISNSTDLAILYDVSEAQALSF